MDNKIQNTGVPNIARRGDTASTSFDVLQSAQLQTSGTPVLSPPPASASPQMSPVSPTPSKPRPPRDPKQSRWRRIGIVALILTLVGGGTFTLFRMLNPPGGTVLSQSHSGAASQFNTLSIPLSELSSAGQLSVDQNRTLNINGQLKVNNSFVVSPSAKPTTGIAGQIYYDQASNQLAYFNGSQFVNVQGSNNVVNSIGGASGSIVLGNGLTQTGNTISAAGVLSIQGQNGAITFTGGPGIVVNGTTLSSSGVLSFGGTTGDITVGNGLNITNNQLRNSGVISVTSNTSTITVTDDGSGNLTLSSSGAGSGTVQSPGGTAGRIAMFTGVQTVADSLLSQSGTTITVNGDLAVTGSATLGTPLAVTSGGTGANNAAGARTNLGAAAAGANSDITSLTGLTTALSVAQGGTGGGTLATNGVLLGNGTSPITSVVAGSAGLCLISNAGAPSWQACPGGSGGVLSLNGLSGNLTLANASASGSTVTINDASTTQKGIVQLNGTNFSVSGGVANTIQDIAVTSTPTFAGINTNSITPSAALTVGATTQNLTLQGANTTITSTSGANNATLSFVAPTANVVYRLQTAAAGTYDVCTTAGNCVGTGGSVSTPGGTANTLAKFTGTNSIGNSLITDNGTVVTIGGDLSVTGTVTLSTPLAVTSGGTGANSAANARTNLGAAASGANSDITSISGLTTALSVIQGGTGATSLTANGVLLGNGTSPMSSLVAGSAGQCLVSTAGAPVWQTCPGSGGVTSVNGLTGTITIANASAAGSTITINDASTSQKGIAQFNSTNFSVSSGVVNTVQDIAPTSAPTFGQLTITSGQATANMVTINNTNGSATGNLLDLQLAGSSRFAVSPAGALTLSSTVNGQTISSAANFTGTLSVTGAASLNGGASVTGALTANTITPSGALTVGATGQSFLLQGNSSSTITSTNGGNTTTLAFQAPTASVTYRLLTAAAGTYDLCTTAGNCTGVGGGVTTPGGTTNRIAKFTGSQAIGDSIISDNGSIVSIGGTLAVNTITPSAALTVGSASQDLTLQGANVSLTSTASGITNTLTFATPSGSNKTITLPNASGTVAVSASGPLVLDASGNLTCPTCSTTGSSVNSLNGLTGALTIANATGSGSTITVNDASTSQKGIAQFNSTNFSASSGTINTIQDINTTAAPTFGQLTITSGQATAGMLTVNNTNASGTGNLLDLQLNGSSRFAVSPAGALTMSGTVNGQTISSAASFTGTLAVAGTTSLNGGASVTGTLNANTITPTGALTVGATGQSFLLQGNASSTIAANNGANATTLAFQSPTANVTYRFLTTSAGTYDVCTTAGNCAGVGGGVTTPGGTTNTIAKFTSSGTIANSIITDNGTTVTIGGALAVNTITPSAAMTIGSASQDLTLQGANVSLTNAASGITNSVVFATPSGSNKTITVPNASGTLAVSASGPLVLDASGNLSCPTCTTSGGGSSGAVDSLNGLNGTLTIANATGSGSTITINDASTSQKGIAQFNSTNFSVSSGTVNTIQDIAVSSAPTFGRLGVTSSQASNAMFLINNTNTGATGNLLDVQLNGSSRLAVNPAGNMTLTGTINGQTISSAANLTGTLAVAGAASLNGGATVTGTLSANTITPTGALTIGATSQSFLVQGSSASTITATSGANTTTLAFQAPTASVTYRFLTAAAGTYDICTTVGNCTGVGGGVTTSGGTTNRLAKFTGSQAIGDSIITDNGSTVTIGGTLAVNTLTPTAALTVGATAQDLTLQGANVNLTSTAGGITNTLAFATPSGSNKTITIPNASGTLVVSASGPLAIDSSGNITCATCSTGTNVSSLNGLTGALTLANASGSGSTVTINDASTSQKGIAQFNSTNFSASSGTINTIQDINATAAPTFGQLTLSSSQASAAMLTVNNTNASGTGNLIDLQLNGSSRFAVSPAGALTLSSTINGQTISSSANFTGTLAVAGTASLNGGASVTGTLSANTITPSSSLTVGATNQSFVLQGNASSTITATNGANTSTVAFQSPTANVTYRFLTAAAGTYDICTTVGNCAGVAGGVTTSGGTTNKIAKFNGSQTLADSIITDDGSTVTIGGTLAVNTITPSSAMTVGATGQNLTLQGATVSMTSTSGGITNTLTFATPAGSNKTITIPNASGTVAISASGPLALDANGNLTCPTCATSSSGVSSLNSLTGALTLANASGSGSTITINDASTSQKGIAQFNNTNFTASSGTINTVQNINTTAAPTFGQLTLTSSQASAVMLSVNNTNASGTGNLADLQLNGSSRFSVSSAGNVTTAGTINGQTISSAANFTGTLTVAGATNLNGGATVKADSTTAFQVQNAGGTQTLLSVDSTGSNINLLGNNSPTLSTWTTTTAMSTGANTTRVRGGSVAANGYLYYFGGVDGTATTVATVSYAKLNTDGTVGTWATTTSMPGARKQFQPVVANGYIYIIGGRDNSNTAQSTTYYAKLNNNGTIGTWNTTTALTAARFGQGTVFYNGYIYVFGGFSSGIVAQSTVYYNKVRADGTLDAAWSTATALPTGLTNTHGAVVANGYVYLVGGFLASGSGTDGIYHAKMNPDGTIGSWVNQTAKTPGGADDNFETFVSNGYLYIVGGDTSNNVVAFPLNADGNVGTGVTQTNFPVSVGEAGMAQANGYFYVLGGSSAGDGGGTVRNTVYYASTSRLKVGGNLDLVGYGGEVLNEGNNGGQLTAGNTTIVGTLQVQDAATFTRPVNINDTLTVSGGASAASLNIGAAFNSSYVLNVQTSTGAAFRGYRTTTTTTDNLLELYSDVGSTTNLKFRVQANGDIFTDGSTTLGTPADVAEKYPTAEPVEAGDVVIFKDGMKLGKTTTPYDGRMAGIVSTDPGLILAGNTEGAALALKGRVPVKVTAENGAIAAGDPLTASSTKPGYAMKATGAGMIIGTALDSHDSGVGSIQVFVNVGYNNPGDNLQGSTQFQDISVQGTLTTNKLNVTGSANINNLTVTGTATIADLHVTNLTTASLTVNGHIISGGGTPTVTVGGGACSGTTATISGTDTAGLVTLITGAGCNTSGNLATVTFNKPFGASPKVTLTPASADAAETKTYVDSGAANANKFTIATPTTSINGSTTYKWYYQVIQ